MDPSALRTRPLPILLLLVVAVMIPIQPVGVAHAEMGGQASDEALTDPRGTNRLNTASVPESVNNSSTIQHENPDNVDTSGGVSSIQQQFASQLSSQLEQTSVNLSQGEYEQAQSLLGEEYSQQLAKYADLAEQTSNTTDDRVSNRLKNTTERYRTYISAVQQYRTVHQQYVAADNETRARRLARELQRLATQINQTGTTLTVSYANVTNNSELNFTKVRQSIANTTANISAQQATIRKQEFTQTNLIIQRHTTNASFQTPFQITGTLTAANGTRLANRTIVVELGSRKVRTNTTTNGSFSLSARPILTARGMQSLPIRYQPQNTSVYLSTETTVTVHITPVTPTVTLTQLPQTVQFNETIALAGQVHVGDENVSAADIPVQVNLGTTVLGTAQTNANGSFTFNTTLPATIPAGSQQLRVTLPLTNRALTTTTTTTPINITQTATQVTVRSSQQSQAQLQLTGQLTTVTGTPISNQTISLEVADQSLATVTTNESGRYLAAINTSILTDRIKMETANVTAVFDGTGNLKSTRATTSVRVQTHGEPWNNLPGSPLIVGGGIIGLGVLGALAVRTLGGSQRTTKATVDSTDHILGQTSDPSTATDSQALLEQATAHLDSGDTNTAVRTAYAALRQHITTKSDMEPEQVKSQTHWEFNRTLQNHTAATDTLTTPLQSVTETFERARFTTNSVSDETAREAIATATDIIPEPQSEESMSE